MTAPKPKDEPGTLSIKTGAAPAPAPEPTPKPAAKPGLPEKGTVVTVVNHKDWRLTKGQGTPVFQPGVPALAEADNWLIDQIKAGCLEVVK
jgi:hypothetical protein